MHSLSWVLIRRRRHLARHPRRGPVTRSSDVSDFTSQLRGAQCAVVAGATPGAAFPGAHRGQPPTAHRSPLTELEPLARSRPPRLLALHHARIARQESLLPQLLAVLLVRQAQRARDREPQRSRLPRHTPAPAQRPHVERAQCVRGRERLLDVRHQRRPGEVVPQRAPVDVPLPRAGRQIHARYAYFAAPHRVPAQLRRDAAAHRAAAAPSGCGCCAAWGWSGPPYTFSICFTFWRDSVVLGSMPQTARSITRSGCFAITFLSGVNRSCPM